MKNLVLFLILIFSVSLFADARKKELKEFLQANQQMPASGKFAGEIIENDEKRTLILLSNGQKRIYGIDTQDLAFANFRHDGQFYIASIPAIKLKESGNVLRGTKVIDSVTFVKEHWAGKTRPEVASIEVHAELIFKFNKTSGIKLIYNQDKKRAASAQTLYGAVLSIEAIRSNQNLDAGFMPAGIGNNFAVGHRFYSLKERANKYKKEKDATFTEYPLNFANTKSLHKAVPRAQDYLVYQAINASHIYGRNQTYNLFLNNCTNRMFDVLDTSIKYNSNSGGKVRFDAIEKNYVKWVNEDLTDALDFLKRMASDRSLNIPEDVSKQINEYSKALALPSLKGMQKKWGQKNSPKNFLYQLPMFIEGHLQARGLLQ